MSERDVLGLTESLAALEAMLEAAERIPGRPVAIAIGDERGDLVCFAAMEGVNPALARQNARKKAYMAACMRADTQAVTERMRAQGMSLLELGNPQFFGGGGGLVVTRTADGLVMGGIGVSGRTGEEDEEIAKIGLAVLKQAAAI